MKNTTNRADDDESIQNVRAKQSNTLWPDTLINSRGVDEFLWRGSGDAPLVQRIAAWIFGVAFVLVGIVWLDVAYTKGWILFGVLSIVWLFVGGKVFLNGFKRRRKATSNHH
ncbi:MAG: hypothetical protein JST28_16730 [Acidobacteria bacterium]|nr:hypothetical protein [Acidobacteriota bacterium]